MKMFGRQAVVNSQYIYQVNQYLKCNIIQRVLHVVLTLEHAGPPGGHSAARLLFDACISRFKSRPNG